MQATPFALWNSMWGSAFALAERGLILSEMMCASAEVAQLRSRSLWEAGAKPAGAELKAFGRLVTEKVDGFSEAGISAIDDIRRLQNDALGQWQQVMALASGARALTGGEARTFLARQTRMLDYAASASGKVMAPLQNRTTANVKRPGKRR